MRSRSGVKTKQSSKNRKRQLKIKALNKQVNNKTSPSNQKRKLKRRNQRIRVQLNRKLSKTLETR